MKSPTLSNFSTTKSSATYPVAQANHVEHLDGLRLADAAAGMKDVAVDQAVDLLPSPSQTAASAPSRVPDGLGGGAGEGKGEGGSGGGGRHDARTRFDAARSDVGALKAELEEKRKRLEALREKQQRERKAGSKSAGSGGRAGGGGEADGRGDRKREGEGKEKGKERKSTADKKNELNKVALGQLRESEYA